jgi:hypothetical protein
MKKLMSRYDYIGGVTLLTMHEQFWSIHPRLTPKTVIVGEINPDDDSQFE